jgi:hypothetical protein
MKTEIFFIFRPFYHNIYRFKKGSIFTHFWYFSAIFSNFFPNLGDRINVSEALIRFCLAVVHAHWWLTIVIQMTLSILLCYHFAAICRRSFCLVIQSNVAFYLTLSVKEGHSKRYGWPQNVPKIPEKDWNQLTNSRPNDLSVPQRVYMVEKRNFSGDQNDF